MHTDKFSGAIYAVDVGVWAHRLGADHFHYSQKVLVAVCASAFVFGRFWRIAALYWISHCY